MKFKITIPRLFVLAVAGCLLFSSPASAARARPKIQNKSLVTDTGKLLRGGRWSTDICNGCLPDRSWVTGIRNLGLNALHLYAESADFQQNAGQLAQSVDTLVNWTDEDGLYLIITIGGVPNYSFGQNFWAFYAPRYQGRTHVIYEIYNEFTNEPSSSVDLQRERTLYDSIRFLAPSTPILLFSYPYFYNGPSVLQDVQSPTLSGVNWNNAAIAFHGYASLTDTTNTLIYVRNAGYPCVQTEFYDVTTNGAQDVAQTEVYEDLLTSWMTFLPLDTIFDDANFKNPLDQGWIVWIADYGTWPATSTPPIGQTVAIQAYANGKWVTIGAGTNPLIASKDTVGASEKFLVVSSGGYPGLKSQGNGLYVGADQWKSYYEIAEWGNPKKLQWMNRPDGTVVFKDILNNKFITADLNVSNPPKLIANRTRGGPWERFLVSVVAP